MSRDFLHGRVVVIVLVEIVIFCCICMQYTLLERHPQPEPCCGLFSFSSFSEEHWGVLVYGVSKC